MSEKRPRLRADQVIAIYLSDQKADVLAAEYNCTIGAICNIWCGIRHKQITKHLQRVNRPGEHLNGRPRSIPTTRNKE